MILLDFGYERAATLEEAAALLCRLGDGARPLAGGTDLLPNMRSEIARPGVLVGLSGIEPEPPRLAADGALRIDALTRLASLAHSALVREKLPMLAESVHAVGSRQIREMGTLGGNLCQETRCLYLNQKHDYQFAAPCFKRGGDCCYPFPRNDPQTCWSVHMSDVAPALIALDAGLEILGTDGIRRIGVEELYTGSGLKPLSLGGAELLSAVTVPAQQRTGWGFHKSTVRGGLEFGMAVIAVSLQPAEDRKTCGRARVVVGAVRERPLRLESAERMLTGALLDDERVARAAADEAVKQINPLPHHGFTRRHLLDNIKVYLRRTLARAAERARAECA